MQFSLPDSPAITMHKQELYLLFGAMLSVCDGENPPTTLPNAAKALDQMLI